MTTKALHIGKEGESTKLCYEDMYDLSYPKEVKKSDVDHFIIHTVQGERVEVYFDVVRGRFRDVWEFSRFVMRVIDDIKRVKGQESS